MPIPKVIYQTHELPQDSLPGLMKRAQMRTARSADGYEVRYFASDQRRDFIERNFPEALDAYDTLVPGAYKADLFRYVVLYVEGGVYLDSGVSPVNGSVRIERLIPKGVRFATSLHPRGCVGHRRLPPLGNAILAAEKGHPIIREVLWAVIDNVRRRKHGSSALCPTGPVALARAFRRCIGKKARLGWNPRSVFIFHYDKSSYRRGPSAPTLYIAKYRGYEGDRSKLESGMGYAAQWRRREVFRT